MLCSLVLHAGLAGLVLAMATGSPRPADAPPPVILDVVFGTPGGDGTPGDGAPGEEGAAGGAGPGPVDPAAYRVPDTPAQAAAPAVPKEPSPPKPAPPERRRVVARKPAMPPSSPLGLKPSVSDRDAAEETGQGSSGSAMAATASGSAATAGGAGGGGGTGPGVGLGGQGYGPGAGGHGGGAFDGEFGAGNGPSFARHVRPEYPPQARRFGKEGVVVLRLCIDAAGNLTQAEIVERAGSGFDEAALTSVKASSYRPADRDGQAVPSRAVLRIRFQLSGT